MDKIVVRGGTPLRGDIAVSGAKNAALPLLFANVTNRRGMSTQAECQSSWTSTRRSGCCANLGVQYDWLKRS